MTWQPAAILYPDAELRFNTDLRALLVTAGESDVKVVRTFPINPTTKAPIIPPRAVQVVRDGGASSNLRDRARMRVNVYDSGDTTGQKANDLARLVVALVPRMVGANGVLRTGHLSGPYEIVDSIPRRYLLFQIDYRGEAL